MKVILFLRDKSFLSRLVSLVTNSKYTHSAVLLKHSGICYFSDSSLSGGIILVPIQDMPKYLNEREFEVFDLLNTSNDTDEDAFYKMTLLSGSKYDVKGATLWLWYRTLRALGLNKKNKKLYCFEYTVRILESYYTLEEEYSVAPSGKTIKELMSELAIKTRFLNCNKVR